MIGYQQRNNHCTDILLFNNFKRLSMRKLLFIILFASTFAISVQNQADAVKGLISRVLGEVRNLIHFIIHFTIYIIYRNMLTILNSRLLKKKLLIETIGLLVKVRMMDIFLLREQRELQFQMLFTCKLNLSINIHHFIIINIIIIIRLNIHD